MLHYRIIEACRAPADDPERLPPGSGVLIMALAGLGFWTMVAALWL
jgi:hypothetical protein